MWDTREKEVVCNGVVKWDLAEPICIRGVGIGTGEWMNVFIVQCCKYMSRFGDKTVGKVGNRGLGKSERDS